MNSITSITQCRVSPLFKKLSIHSIILFVSVLPLVLNCSSYEKIPNEKRMIFTYEAKRVFKDCNKDIKDKWDKDYKDYQLKKPNKQEFEKLGPDPCPGKLEIENEENSTEKGKKNVNITYKSSELKFDSSYKFIKISTAIKLGEKEYFYCLEPVGPLGILKDTSTSASIQNPAKLDLTIKHDSKDSAVKIYNMTDALQYLSFNYCQMYGAGVLSGEEYKLKLDNLQRDISCLLGVQPRCSQ